MEPLYTTQFTYTLDEYKKFSNAVNFSKKNKIILSVFFIILSACFGVFIYYFTDDIAYSVFGAVLFLVCFFITIPRIFNKASKKIYESSKLINNEINYYEFFEAEMKITDSRSISTISYTDLTKIIENETNFYLMIADNQGFIILKDNCSSELISFLRSLKNKTAR